ncbi:MAG TPA: alternate F1F0 ATPase, F1 subunit alpha [Anaerolineales bacterium]|nr:alternate F1F0 ATPase, F1 subunit alpha [Anaerolineales bacterium]
MTESTTRTVLQDAAQIFKRGLEKSAAQAIALETGRVAYIGQGIARVSGLPGIQMDELIRFPGGVLGTAFNLDEDEVGVVLLGKDTGIQAGSEVRRTGRLLDVTVGEELLGRVITPTGAPLDGRGSLLNLNRLPVEREATPIMKRAPVVVPLQTGIKVVDALVPIGRGQRELILGDRQTGKTAIALDTIINQREQNMVCVYCAIGQRNSAVAQFVADLEHHSALDYSVVVVAGAEETPGLQFIAPYAATTIGEYFMEQGRDVLVIYDDLTRHAWAYREMSLLLRRPPGREAYPGDIFYIHSRLLERSTRLRESLGGGSLTALPIAETEAQNLSAYIPTNLISITDGQVYLSPDLFQKGILPAVDLGKSVSRVGGKTQLPAYRAVAGDLGLSYAQFEELETFARFGTRLDDDTRRTIARGERVREVLKQPQYKPVHIAEQIAVFLAVIGGYFDDMPLAKIALGEKAIREAVVKELPDVCKRIEQGVALSDEDREALERVIVQALDVLPKDE